MCIVLLTTKHPAYALIIINNRDEFIVRPTTRPHWWSLSPPPSSSSSSSPPPPPAPTHPEDASKPNQAAETGTITPKIQILSSRDLNRPERGTWLGITRTGNFACLTNYRETDSHDAANPVHGIRSRGAIASAWLGADPAERTSEFVQRMLSGGGIKGVGGFSLICGRLRAVRGSSSSSDGKEEEKNIEPLAIISNRSEHPTHVPWIAGSRGETHGLSNSAFDADGPSWPKVVKGRQLLDEAVAASNSATEDDLVASLFSVLDTDTLPRQADDVSFEEYIPLLKHSIFVPPLGGAARRKDMEAFGDEYALRQCQQQPKSAETNGTATAPSGHVKPCTDAAAETTPVGAEPHPADDEQITGFMTGLYGTQRQTVILVDWDGRVRYTERALWDETGRPAARGEGDVTFRFRIEDWE